MLLTCRGTPVALYEAAADALATRDRFNLDPFVEPGKPDPDAPYSVELWSVTPMKRRGSTGRIEAL